MTATLTPLGSTTTEGGGDPLLVIKELITLRRLVGLYPAGHPQIGAQDGTQGGLKRPLHHAPMHPTRTAPLP